MEFSQVVANRHSVRDFTDQPVSREDLVDVVRTAQQAPSWVNSQPWRVYAATGRTLEEIKKRHAADVAAGRKGASDLPVMSRTEWSLATQANMAALAERIGSDLGDAASEFPAAQARMFNAQAVLYITIPTGSPLWSLVLPRPGRLHRHDRPGRRGQGTWRHQRLRPGHVPGRGARGHGDRSR